MVRRFMPSRLPVLGAVAVAFALVLAFAPAVGAAGGSTGPDPIYKNNSYSFAERAADLVSRMTLAEKSSQMSATRAPAIPRLGVHAWGWWNEANHGVAFEQLYPPFYINQLVNTTTYPVDLALGSSWDPTLMYAEATQIGDEARETAPENFLGLDFFTPTVNLSRDPRWGRNDETFSEDPLLSAKMGSQFVDGLQGETPDGHLLAEGGGYLKTIATLKHYAANNSENNRMTGSSDVDQGTLREYYTSQFGQIVDQSHPGGVMSAFNEVNGTPASADRFLIDTLARQTFGFGGYFTSDCDSVDDIAYGHSWRPPGYVRSPTPTEIRAVANAAGEDLECNLPYTTYSYRNTLAAAAGEGIKTQPGVYSVNDMDASLVRLFTARMQTGEFNDVNNEPWVKQARSELGNTVWPNLNSNNAITETPSRIGLDQSVADHTQVLLKNAPVARPGGAAPVLPIGVPTGGTFKVAVYGLFANQQSPYLGDYSSYQSGAGLGRVVNDYAGIKAEIQSIDPQAQVDYYSGFTGGDSASTLTSIDQNAVNAAVGYNDVIVVAGTDYGTAHEGLDRTGLDLPGAQAQLISELDAKNPNTIAVLQTVGDVNVGSFEPSTPGILWSSFNGEREGLALADVLLGHYDPSGHLPFTWYASDSELPSIDDYRIRPGRGTPGRTYLYFRGPVSYPFGYGLSYTTFATTNLRLSKTHLTPNDTLDALVDVKNTGNVYGEDLVQLYVTKSGAGNPVKRLEGFQQVALAPGQTATVKIPVKILSLAFWRGGHYTVDPGLYGIQVGSSANNVLLSQYVAVGGELIRRPATVTASPTMTGDRARGILERVMFPVGTTINPNLTVATNDGSLYGYGHSAPLPKAMRITYSSNRPKVISVAKDGTIATVANGVATITVKAIYHGGTAYGTFVVRVLSELNAITFQMKTASSKGKKNKNKSKTKTKSPQIPLPGFEPDIYSYDIIVPYGVRLPRIAATTMDKRAHVHVGQVNRVPGTARIRITGPDGLTQTYSLYFARPALRQSFSGSSTGSQWTWIRHDPVNEVVSGGALEITTQQGDLSGDTRPGTNLLVQPALGNWTITTRMTLSSPPSVPGQQAGIIAYQDDQNYLKFDWEDSGGAVQLVEASEDNLSGTPVMQTVATYPIGHARNDTVWLRMVKSGPHYTTYFSLNGRSWRPVYTVGASLQDVQVGLFAWNGPAPGPTLRASFGYFDVNNKGPVNLRSLH
jgi:beta-glucosidase